MLCWVYIMTYATDLLCRIELSIQMVHDIGSNEESHTRVCPAQNDAIHKSGRHTPKQYLKNATTTTPPSKLIFFVFPHCVPAILFIFFTLCRLAEN